ncbi:MAG: ribonuclease P protein component [Nocardioidaceae bacterium]|nr:ribonuclease P protein component [Nocardioidaceae bacterium]MCL2612774.1 ribonuclease P protein component [Nocardioidaceae bacterium]
MVDAASFRATTRRGRRAGSATLVTHLLADPAVGGLVGVAGPLAGFVVSNAVGNAVVRNRVKRRLRHLVAERIDALPASSRLVVRANPVAATASYRELGSDLDRCLKRVLGPDDQGARST